MASMPLHTHLPEFSNTRDALAEMQPDYGNNLYAIIEIHSDCVYYDVA